MDDHSTPFDESEFSGSLPLFPLPNVVLLPGGVLSLHIFEQRYRDMMRDVKDEERLIGMALLKPGFETDYDGNPRIYKRVCLGQITQHQELEDGRWLITLRGRRRVDVLSEDFSKSYRVAQVRVVKDIRGTLNIELNRLRRLVAQLAVRGPNSKFSQSKELQTLFCLPPENLPNSQYFDLVAAVVQMEFDHLRGILEANTVCERAHRVVRALIELIHKEHMQETELLLQPSWN